MQKCKGDKWKVTNYIEHTCPSDRHNFASKKARVAHFPCEFIDDALYNLKINYFTVNEGLTAFKTEINQNVNQKPLKRLLKRQFPMNNEASRILKWWFIKISNEYI